MLLFHCRGRLFSRSNIVELLHCRRRIIDDSQCLQVSVVCLPRDFEVAERDKPPPSSFKPTPGPACFTSYLLSDFEFLGIIDDHLHPKNRTGFIVHFQPVLFNAMFDPCPGDSAAPDSVLHVRDDFAAEMPGQFPSKETHDILGAKTQGAVAK